MLEPLAIVFTIEPLAQDVNINTYITNHHHMKYIQYKICSMENPEREKPQKVFYLLFVHCNVNLQPKMDTHP